MNANPSIAPATARRAFATRFLRWRLAVPPEKGGWVWWIGPLVVGAACAPAPGLALVLVSVAALAAFCFRQPVTLATRQLRKGRDKRDLAPPLFWVAAYGSVLIFLAFSLWSMGYGRILVLGLVALPVFAWHVVLVYRGRDRHQMLLDISAAMALALAGPAAYWAAGGSDPTMVRWVWALPAMQSTASIVHMFVRLKQRALSELPPLRARLTAGGAPMAVHAAGAALAVLAWLAGHAGFAVVFAMAIPGVEGAWSVAKPQIAHAPKRLGMRQLAVSSAAMMFLAVGLRAAG
jgi:hypothetical protein